MILEVVVLCVCVCVCMCVCVCVYVCARACVWSVGARVSLQRLKTFWQSIQRSRHRMHKNTLRFRMALF